MAHALAALRSHAPPQLILPAAAWMLQGPLYRQQDSVGFGERQTLHTREVTHEEVRLKQAGTWLTAQGTFSFPGHLVTKPLHCWGPVLKTVHAGPDAKAAKHTDSTKPKPCKLVSADNQARQAPAECLLPTSGKFGRWLHKVGTGKQTRQVQPRACCHCSGLR